MAVIYVSTWSGFHTNYPQALHSVAPLSKWDTLAALSALSSLRHSDHTIDAAGGYNTKTAITDRASELAAPFAPHMDGTITAQKEGSKILVDEWMGRT